jgi:RNA polymerase sigma-70 factor (ECF subfamily)
MQDAYCAAFTHLDQFAGGAKFSTWLLSIGRNEGLARLRRRARLVPLAALSQPQDEERESMTRSEPAATPEERASSHEVIALVEAAIEELPEEYRQVFVLRVLEALETSDTALVLGLSAEAVKQRLHRARALLQARVEAQVGAALQAAFGFLGPRCDRVVAGVMQRIIRGAPST